MAQVSDSTPPFSSKNSAKPPASLSDQADAQSCFSQLPTRGSSRKVSRPHLVIIVTSGLITTFFRGQIARLVHAGFRVTFICTLRTEAAYHAAEGAEVIILPVNREIAPLADLRSLWTLWRTLRRLRPEITSVGTPKGGLLGGIAACLAGVPGRVYTIHGLRAETETGWKRRLLLVTERISCACAQYVRCVGSSLREKAIELGVVPPDKAYIVGSGTANGTDCERLRRTPAKLAATSELRRQLKIPETAPVVGFVGRLVRDKGIHELWRSYRSLKSSFPDLHLLLVGDFEEGDPIDPVIRGQLETDSGVRLIGLVADAAPYYFLMNVLALPSYREGFPNTPCEAAAASVPAVVTRATGVIDSVIDGATGLLVPAGDALALTAALKSLLENPERCARMGAAGEEWVHARFRQEIIWDALISDYSRVLRETCPRFEAGTHL